jgi:hypothetical protein
LITFVVTRDIMAVRKRFINPFARRESVEQPVEAHDIESPADSKPPFEKSHETDQDSSDEVVIDEKAQAGTQKAQASTQAWTKNTLIAAYIL